MKSSDIDLLREAAAAALQNAGALLADAELLFEHRRIARALSVAILGQEEVGKALYFAAIASGRIGGDLSCALAVVRDHSLKQALQRAAVVLASLHSVPARPLERTWGILQASAQYLETIGAPSVKEMKQRARKQLNTTAEVINFVRWQTGVRGAPRARVPDLDKMAGFYVDVIDGSVLQPVHLRARAAEAEINNLRNALTSLQVLRESLENDAAWTALLSMMSPRS